MIMLARFVLGLLVLEMVVASPRRFGRQVELDTYDSNNYDVDIEDLNLKNREDYDYYDGLTIDEPQIEIGTLAPDEDSDPEPAASLEEEEDEQEEEESEKPIRPMLISQGSGGSGVLMGPDAKGEEELLLAPVDILHISGDSLGSGEVSGASGDSLGSGGSGSGEALVSGSGEPLVSGSGEPLGSGASGDLSGSGASGDLGSGASGGSGFSGSGIILVPGKEEELPLVPGMTPQEASGDSGVSGVSGESGESGESGVSGESGESGDSGVILVPDLTEEEELLPTTHTTPQEGTGGAVGSGGSGLPEPDPDTRGMPTCLLCTCLGGSVYCDDLKLESVPPLPKETTHFYARYNKITKINKSDFANLNKLKRIDLTSNAISSIDEDALFGLPALEELVVRENSVAQLPPLPPTMTLIDASHNNLGSKGIQNEAFKDMTGLLYLYLTDNNIDYIPVPLPDSLRSLHLQNNNIQMLHEDTFCNLKDMNYIRNGLEDIRLDGNPINLSRTPQAYVCLPRIPVGALI